MVVYLTDSGVGFDAEDPTCTVEAEGVELVGPSGERSTKQGSGADRQEDWR